MALKDEFFTVAEAAKKLGVTRQTFYRWIYGKRVGTEKLGREILIPKHFVDDLWEKQMSIQIVNGIIEAMKDGIQERFNYSSDDVIHVEEMPNNSSKNPFIFSVVKKDGSNEKVAVLLKNITVKGSKAKLELEISKEVVGKTTKETKPKK